MKAIYYNIFGLGHINPTLPLVKDLIKNGVEVIYHSSPVRRELIEGAGAEFINYGHDEYSAADFNPGKNFVLQTIPATVGLLPFLTEEFERIRPDFIIYDSMAIWGHVIALIYGIPSFCSVTTFALSEEEKIETLIKHGVLLDEVNTRSMDFLEKEYNVKLSLSQTLGAYGEHNIVFTSKDFNPPVNGSDPLSFFYAGAMVKVSNYEIDFPIQLLKEIKKTKKIITMAFGTIILQQDPEALSLYKKLMEAFKGDKEHHLVLAVGSEKNLKFLGDLPENVMAFSYIPQIEILKVTDCFVTHGGMNSLNEALHFGVPLLVIPHVHDQFGNAKRVDDLKLGINLRKDGVTEEILRESILSILGDGEIQTNVRKMSKSFNICQGTEGILGYINNFVGQKAR